MCLTGWADLGWTNSNGEHCHIQWSHTGRALMLTCVEPIKYDFHKCGAMALGVLYGKILYAVHTLV